MSGVGLAHHGLAWAQALGEPELTWQGINPDRARALVGCYCYYEEVACNESMCDKRVILTLYVYCSRVNAYLLFYTVFVCLVCSIHGHKTLG